MTTNRSDAYLIGLVKELCRLPREAEWVEFKHNNDHPQEIGEYISALANAAALNGKAFAYLLWGIENDTHQILGSDFDPGSSKKGNEPLENWLLRLLTPKIHFSFYTVELEERRVVLLEIARAVDRPVSFSGTAYIRVGEVKKPIKEAPDRERTLWRIFEYIPFENLVAAERQDSNAVVQLLDYPAYFDLLKLPLPSNLDGILEPLKEDQLIQPCPAGDWNITHLGAILFAKKLSDFPRLARKAMRVIQYRGNNRIETLKEQVGIKGYAAEFEGLIDYINNLLPSNEVIGRALRTTKPMFPDLAIRELVANALIHQDFFVTGAGPMVEIFEERIEITNPGEPLVDVRRFIDMPPRSRNEALASMMRRSNICEERGSGFDKVISQVELFQLPAPLIEVPQSFTRVVLFAHRPLNNMDKEERSRACYLHACLKRVMHDYLTNTSVRERFGIDEKNKARASRIIQEAVESGQIKPFDESSSRKFKKYVPYWA